MSNGLGKKEDSFLIGFVSTSLMSGAISIKEAHQWVYNIIDRFDDAPTYIYSLPETKNWKEFEREIGFDTISNLSSREFDALRGISFLRGNRTDEEAITKKSALKALKDNPQLEKRFRDTFPFIDF